MKSSNKQINELKDKARSGQMDDGISFEDVELGDDNFNQYWKDVHPKIREEKRRHLLIQQARELLEKEGYVVVDPDEDDSDVLSIFGQSKPKKKKTPKEKSETSEKEQSTEEPESSEEPSRKESSSDDIKAEPEKKVRRFPNILEHLTGPIDE